MPTFDGIPIFPIRTEPWPGAVLFWGCHCYRCEYNWVPQNYEKAPERCAKCNNPLWDVPRSQDK